MPAIIDAHQHFWQLTQPFDYGWLHADHNAPICRDFLPDDLRPHLQATGVARTVVVQTQHNILENRWALNLAERHEFLAGVVGWVDLAGPQCEEQVLEFRAHPKFVGVRHVVQDERDDDFIVRPEVMRGLKILEKHQVPFDLLFYVKHLRHAVTVAHAMPQLSLVIDHLAKPNVKQHFLDDWLLHFRAAAAYPNVYCKLSGLVTEAHWQRWTVADLKPYVHAALELFGPQRCMFGSDWPVCELAATYEQVYQALVDAVGPLSAGDRDAIFSGTAARFYGLATQS
jgi:L-fuconolactonase